MNSATHFPIIVHKDRRSDYGIIVPDIPGCFTSGKTLDEALRNVQEAVEVHLHGESAAPQASTLDRWTSDPLARDAYAVTLAPVDLSFLEDATVRINITARKSELMLVDRAAKLARMDRSAYLIGAALERAVTHNKTPTTHGRAKSRRAASKR